MCFQAPDDYPGLFLWRKKTPAGTGVLVVQAIAS